MTTMGEGRDSLVGIPDLGPGECAVVESLLQAAEVFYVSQPGDSEYGPRLLINASDRADVKEMLADFRIRTASGQLVPIPW
jgi:hypothetical protein